MKAQSTYIQIKIFNIYLVNFFSQCKASRMHKVTSEDRRYSGCGFDIYRKTEHSIS